MSISKDLTKQFLDRVMNLKTFTVQVKLEDEWNPNGRVPFDIRISNKIATVEVSALTIDEAKEIVSKYFGSNDFI
jgi:outer membrane protein W